MSSPLSKLDVLALEADLIGYTPCPSPDIQIIGPATSYDACFGLLFRFDLAFRQHDHMEQCIKSTTDVEALRRYASLVLHGIEIMTLFTNWQQPPNEPQINDFDYTIDDLRDRSYSLQAHLKAVRAKIRSQLNKLTRQARRARRLLDATGAGRNVSPVSETVPPS